MTKALLHMATSHCLKPIEREKEDAVMRGGQIRAVPESEERCGDYGSDLGWSALES